MAHTISALFDSREEAQRAVADLREAGVADSALSIVARSGSRGVTSTDVDGETDADDGDHTNILRGILGGGALGAGLGVAALAIPGVGPLVAAGAIAASAVPGAMAIGAAAGAAAGTFNEALKSHGVSDDDAAYYGERMGDQGVLVTVTGDSGVDTAMAEEILTRNGGHNASRARTATASYT